MSQTNILIIGGGNMASAIIAGLLQNGCEPKSIYVVDRNQDKCDALTQKYQIQTTTNIDRFLGLPQIVILAIKPQGAKELCLSLQSHFKTHPALIISIMAGITLANLAEWLGADLAIVRGMPNTPSHIQAGATALYANSKVDPAQKKQVQSLLEAMGTVAWLKQEADIDTITALSGSGPAYYFYFMEIMQNAAIKMGLSPETARQFAIQTAYGAAKLALETGEDLTELRHRVTSKKGTTAAALEVMQAKNLALILEEALTAARKRSFELSQGF